MCDGPVRARARTQISPCLRLLGLKGRTVNMNSSTSPALRSTWPRSWSCCLHNGAPSSARSPKAQAPECRCHGCVQPGSVDAPSGRSRHCLRIGHTVRPCYTTDAPSRVRSSPLEECSTVVLLEATCIVFGGGDLDQSRRRRECPLESRATAAGAERRSKR
jgi:hypothetical protein